MPIRDVTNHAKNSWRIRKHFIIWKHIKKTKTGTSFAAFFHRRLSWLHTFIYFLRFGWVNSKTVPGWVSGEDGVFRCSCERSSESAHTQSPSRPLGVVCFSKRWTSALLNKLFMSVGEQTELTKTGIKGGNPLLGCEFGWALWGFGIKKGYFQIS